MAQPTSVPSTSVGRPDFYINTAAGGPNPIISKITINGTEYVPFNQPSHKPKTEKSSLYFWVTMAGTASYLKDRCRANDGAYTYYFGRDYKHAVFSWGVPADMNKFLRDHADRLSLIDATNGQMLNLHGFKLKQTREVRCELRTALTDLPLSSK